MNYKQVFTWFVEHFRGKFHFVSIPLSTIHVFIIKILFIIVCICQSRFYLIYRGFQKRISSVSIFLFTTDRESLMYLLSNFYSSYQFLSDLQRILEENFVCSNIFGKCKSLTFLLIIMYIYQSRLYLSYRRLQRNISSALILFVRY